MLRLSNTRLSLYRSCPKKYYWCYIRNIVPKKEARPLEIGGSMHDALALHYQGKLKEASDFASKDSDVSRLYNAYATRFPKEEFDVIALEHFTEAPLVPEEDIWYVVKSDGIIRYRDLLFTLEHKTVARLGPSDIQRYIHGPQIKGYIWGMRETLKKPVHGCLWNFIIKTKTVEFQRIPQLYKDFEINQWLEYARGWAIEIDETLKMYNELQRPSCFKMDLGACFTFMGECQYTPVCFRGGDTPELIEGLYNVREEQEKPLTRLNKKEEEE
jgi:hypothetical protein